MDNVVLTRVAAALGESLERSVLRSVHGEGPHRFRWTFLAGERPRSLVVSLDRALPWIGRPAARRVRRRAPAVPSAARVFVAGAGKRLCGMVVDGLVKPVPADRRIEIRFADGQRIVIELTPPSPVMVALDADGRVAARAGGGRAARERLAVGAAYAPRDLPAGRLDPFSSGEREIDERLRRAAAEGGRGGADSMRRSLAGVGAETVALVLEESRRSGRSAGQVLAVRLEAVLRGRLDPVIEAPWPPEEAASRGVLRPADCRLLPWSPDGPPPDGFERFGDRDPARTAGRYHEALEAAREAVVRAVGLDRLLEAEIVKLRQIAVRVEADRERFADPEAWKHRGEALLAGIDRAERDDDGLWVPDPYDPGGPPLRVPAEPGLTPAQAAEACFRAYRRARRGRQQGEERAARVAGRLDRLQRLAASAPTAPTAEAIERLERGMREAGVPVALDRPAPRARIVHRPPVRLEGVRIFRTADGWTAMIGKSGRDNAHLTFRIAGPEDFWFHAEGVPGAHVVLRNDERRPRPPRASLEQAAAAAAWFSESRNQGSVDVRWTRRKYVRKLRGAAPGTVRIKRFETVRVRPALPSELQEAP